MMSENKKDNKAICEVRQANITSEFRADASEGEKLVIRGYPIIFNNPTKIRDWGGEYEEVILETALDKTDLTDVYLLGGHNADNLLGRAGKNMRLEKDGTGLFFEAVLPNTTLGRDYYNLIKGGLLDGMSFGFSTSDNISSDGIRKIRAIDKLYEITLTPFPAYLEASVVAARSETPRQDEPKLTLEQALNELKEKMKQK